jgi:hypothetical protein
MQALIRYFAELRPGKTVLWCYLIWYLVTVINHFDPAPSIWINSIGISAVIGVGLLLSVSQRFNGSPDRWQTFRLFLMPFCVSSFSALIKGHGFVVIFPSSAFEVVVAAGACGAFVAFVTILKSVASRRSA